MANGIVLNKKISNQSFELDEMISMFFEELKSFCSQYDHLGSIRYEEYREYDSIEYEYYIKNIGGKSPIDLIPTIKEIESHMKEFSIANDAYEFYLSSRILFER